MGMSSYLCKGCKRGLHEGESCRLTLVDKGKVLKKGIGTYDGYGGIEEDINFRPDKKSDTDPYNNIAFFHIEHGEGGVTTSLLDEEYYYGLLNDYIDKNNGISFDLTFGSINMDHFFYRFKVPESGVVAWHQKCYDKAYTSKKICLIPSYHDPDQGCKSDREYIEDEIKTIKKRLEVLEKELRELPEEDE